MASNSFGKIVWAVNAMDDLDRHAQAISLLGALSRATRCAVEPVHILSPPYLSEAFRKIVLKNLDALVRASRIPTMRPGRIIDNNSVSIRSEVDAIIEYANRDSDAIVVATHSRSRISRLFMGSFAETLSLQSPLPIFTVNPETSVRERFSKVLFPTDLDPSYREYFERAVFMAKSLEAGLTLYYKEPLSSEYSGISGNRALATNAVSERLAQAEEWRRWAMTYHVQVEILIDNQPGAIAQSIEQFSTRNNFDLIAMPSHGTEISAAVMGSKGLQMLRDAHCQVWIMRAQETE